MCMYYVFSYSLFFSSFFFHSHYTHVALDAVKLLSSLRSHSKVIISLPCTERVKGLTTNTKREPNHQTNHRLSLHRLLLLGCVSSTLLLGLPCLGLTLNGERMTTNTKENLTNHRLSFYRLLLAVYRERTWKLVVGSTSSSSSFLLIAAAFKNSPFWASLKENVEPSQPITPQHTLTFLSSFPS